MPPSTHILPALVLLRKPLSGLAKRQLSKTLGDSILVCQIYIDKTKEWLYNESVILFDLNFIWKKEI